MIKTYESESKPRFDGGGSEFGDMHRYLPKNFGMFDIDRMKGKAIIDLELTKQEISFLEYRTDFKNCTVRFTALFEIKYKDSEYVRKCMKIKTGTAIFAQIDLCRQINSRYFFVIANYGEQPFDFFEYKFDLGFFVFVGRLEYDKETKVEKIKKFWSSLQLDSDQKEQNIFDESQMPF